MGSGEKSGRRNAKVGIVKSDGMDKTVVVSVERRVPHPLYRRIVTRTSNFWLMMSRTPAVSVIG